MTDYSAAQARRIRKLWKEQRDQAWKLFNESRPVFYAILEHTKAHSRPPGEMPGPQDEGIIVSFKYEKNRTEWRVTCGNVPIEQGPR